MDSQMLNRPTQFTLIFLLASLANSAESQDASPSYQHLKPIESMIGIWKARFDPPGNVPEGELEIHFQWMVTRIICNP